MSVPDWFLYAVLYVGLFVSAAGLLAMFFAALWLVTEAVRGIMIYIGHWGAFCEWYVERVRSRRSKP